jgi:tetratricopeptide (TPR) repeat protein
VIHSKTEGNPLFIADLTHYLRDCGVFSNESGTWRLARPLPDLEREMPDSVRAMIQRKIDQLTEEDHRFLVAASVQGYEFDSTLVAKVLNLDPADVEERLESLERVYSLVRLVAERELPGHVLSLRYRFVHVLYQNALYSSLRPSRRAQLSAAVANAMQTYYGKRSASVALELAFLFEAARDWTQAAENYLTAARAAMRVFANHEAAALAERGLKSLVMLPDTPERMQQELKLQMTRGPSLMAAMGFAAPEVEQTFVRACELSSQLGARTQLFNAQFNLSIAYLVKADCERSLERAEQCLELAEDLHNPGMLMQSHWVMGLSRCYRGQLTVARSHLEQTISIHDGEAIDSPVSLYGGLLSRAHLARLQLYMGYPDQSKQLMSEAFVRAERLGHPIGFANTFWLAAQIETLHRNAQKAEELAEAISRHSEEHGLPYYAAIGMMTRGWAQAIRGETDMGIKLLRDGLTSYLATGTRQQHAHFLALLAEALDEAGRVTEAIAELDEAIKVAAQSGECYYESELHRLRGVLLLKSEPASSSEAETSFLHAISLARTQNAKWFELRAAVSLARVWKQQGKPEEACRMLGETHSWFTEGFDLPDMKNAELLLTDCL